MNQRPSTLGQLRDSGYRPRSVKRELRDNVRQALATGAPLFPGVLGYEVHIFNALNKFVLWQRCFNVVDIATQSASDKCK